MTSSHPVERREVVVVGAGQSGLAASNLLRQRGVDQLVLERGVVANMWDTMPWRAFRLVTQNWQCRLPGQDEPPGGPDSFMDAPDIRDHLRAYAARLAGEVRCGVEVKLVEPLQEGGYGIETSAGPLEAEAVIVATGAFHAPRIPDLAAGLDRGLRQLHSSEYRAAEELPPGGVLVVGSGQSGWQIARELHRAGRRVAWSMGRGTMVPRSYRGQDIFRWFHALGLLDLSMEEHPGGDLVREEPRPFFYELEPAGPADPGALAAEGMTLLGRVEGAQGGRVRLSADRDSRLGELERSSLAITELVDTYIELEGLQAPPGAQVVSGFRPAPATRELDLNAQGITSVIWATGYCFTWQRWIRADIFDRRGYPRATRGVTSLPGLYFLGLTWMHGWGSGLLYGVTEDTTHVVDHLTGAAGGGS